MTTGPRKLDAETKHSLLRRVEGVLDDHVRPGLKADGGDVAVVDLDDDSVLQVRLLGACQGCPSSVYTMTMGIEATVKRLVPEVRFIEAVP